MKNDHDAAVAALLETTRILVGIASSSVEHLPDLHGTVTLPGFRLLLALAELGPAPSSAVAARLDTVGSSVTRLADRLEESGHLARHRERPNRSVVRLELTASGHDLVDRVLRRRREDLAAVVDGLPPGAAGRLATALREFCDAAGGGSARGPMELTAR